MSTVSVKQDESVVEHVDDKLDDTHLEQRGEADTQRQTTYDAIIAEEAEHAMPVLLALKTYRSATLWSMAISLVIVMDGYDTGREWEDQR